MVNKGCFKYYFLLIFIFIVGCQEKVPLPVDNEGRCSFSDIKLPENAVVYAVGTYSGKDLIYQIDAENNTIPSEVNIYINEPDQPIILLLVGKIVDVWQVRHTPKTKIAAVYVGNSSKTRVFGLGEHIPVIMTTFKGDECESIHYQYSYSDKNMVGLDPIAAKFLNRTIAQKIVEYSSKDKIYLGKQLPDEAYIQDRVVPTESLRVPNTPLLGMAGLDEAVQRGEIRPVTQEELQKWYQSEAIPKIFWRRAFIEDGYIHLTWPVFLILKPFKIPAGIYGRSVNFILAENIPMPAGELGHALLIDLNTKNCFQAGFHDRFALNPDTCYLK